MTDKEIEMALYNEHDLTPRQMLKLMAFFMNCDNLKLKFKPKEKYNYKSFKGVSPSGMQNASRLILNGIDNQLLKKEFIDYLLTVKDLKPEKELKPNEKYMTGIGLQVICMIWKVEPEFRQFADGVFYGMISGKKSEEVKDE